MSGINKYKGIYREAYLIHEKYIGITKEADFDKLLNEARALSKKYSGCKFARDFLRAIIDEIEREFLINTGQKGE